MEKGWLPEGQDLQGAVAGYLACRDQEHLHRLVQAGTGLVHHFTALYIPGGPREDAAQAGFEGLLKAAARYDPSRGVAFSTYAGHCIMGEIRHYLRKEASYQRPGWAADLQHRVNRVVEQYLQETGEAPTIGQIAGSLNIREEGVLEIMRCGLVSLDEIDISKVQSIRYESFKLPIEDRISLAMAMNKLSDLQRRVVTLLFYRDMTQSQAAGELGLSQRKVSRILAGALKKLKDCLSG
jgi:RNA polymerase sigma-B factor